LTKRVQRLGDTSFVKANEPQLPGFDSLEAALPVACSRPSRNKQLEGFLKIESNFPLSSLHQGRTFIMAKFYVQSGTLRAIVDSADADRAALWAIHSAMEQIMPLDSIDDVEWHGDVGPANMIALAETIQLSEAGFDRTDCLHVDTLEAFQHWNQLIQAIEKLQKVLAP